MTLFAWFSSFCIRIWLSLQSSLSMRTQRPLLASEVRRWYCDQNSSIFLYTLYFEIHSTVGKLECSDLGHCYHIFNLPFRFSSEPRGQGIFDAWASAGSSVCHGGDRDLISVKVARFSHAIAARWSDTERKTHSRWPVTRLHQLGSSAHAHSPFS